MRTIAILLLGTACSQPAPRLAAPVLAAASTPDAAATDATIAVTRPDVDVPPEPSSIENAEITGANNIHIAVSWLTMTGTMHTAADLTITTPHGVMHLDDDTHLDALHDEPLPLVDRIVPAGEQRWVVLGWASGGEGMQSEHAWLVEDAADGPRIIDTLVWVTDRMHGGVALETSARDVIVGIPLPGAPTRLHNPTMWQLRHGADQLTLDRVKQLPAHTMSVKTHYTPPDDALPSERDWSGRFAMFETTATGFVLRRP